jgi:hypothetical protein
MFFFVRRFLGVESIKYKTLESNKPPDLSSIHQGKGRMNTACVFTYCVETQDSGSPSVQIDSSFHTSKRQILSYISYGALLK